MTRLNSLLCFLFIFIFFQSCHELTNRRCFEAERIDRIKKDFTLSEEELIKYLKLYMPDITGADLAKWEENRSLECMMIDGNKIYFKWAGKNLFRIDKECKKIWDEFHKNEKPEIQLDLVDHADQIIRTTLTGNQDSVLPVRFQITYSIYVDENATPDNEIISCWIPFPRSIPGRQTDIKLIRSDPPFHTIADNSALQRTVYLEKCAIKDQKTLFSVDYEFTSHGIYHDIDPEKVLPVDPTGPLNPFIQEAPPHIVFTDDLIKLNIKIVGSETNPYRIAQKIFNWMDENIPWASAREYSTVRNLSGYCYANMHGDCGIKTMLFITLLRMNGIPAKWRSGWRFQPPSDTMHDWGMVYFKPYGWMPMDITRGILDHQDQRVRWFYLNGMDSYRLIFNDAVSVPFQPRKRFFRSEMIDSQRGEVEWREGNLYFDKWSWNMKWTCSPVVE